MYRKRVVPRFMVGDNDVATFEVADSLSILLTIPAGGNTGSKAVNLWNSFRLSQYYENYHDMFDAVHLGRVSITLTGHGQIILSSSSSSPTIVTAFDRNGIDPETGSPPPYTVISTYESARIRQWSVGSTIQEDIYISPFSAAEADFWVPLGLLRPPTGDNDVPDNPCNVYSSSVVPYKPTLLIGAIVPLVVAAPQTLQFSCQIRFDLTFRGLRKPGVPIAPPAPEPEPEPDPEETVPEEEVPDPGPAPEPGPAVITSVYIDREVRIPLSQFEYGQDLDFIVEPAEYMIMVDDDPEDTSYTMTLFVNATNERLPFPSIGPYYFIERALREGEHSIGIEFEDAEQRPVVGFVEHGLDENPSSYNLYKRFFKFDFPPH